MTDIIGRAENLSKSWHRTQPGLTNVLDELIAELKAARAENDKLINALASTRSQRNLATKNCYLLAAELAELTAPPKIHDTDFGDEAVT